MVNMYADFHPLEEIIVGDLDPMMEPDPFLQQVWREVKEDLDNLADVLKKQGVNVLRPAIIPDLSNSQVQFNSKTIAERCSFPLAIRDFYLVAGNDILLTYGSYANRYFEDWHLYDIFMQLHQQGAGFESMPKPPSFSHPHYANNVSTGCDFDPTEKLDKVLNGLYKTKSLNEARSLTLRHNHRFMIYRTYLKDYLVFHSAGVAHCGDTLIRSRCGSKLGCDWFDRWAKNKGFRVEVLDSPGHIDGYFNIVRPGLIVADVKIKDAVAKWTSPLAQWEYIWVDHKMFSNGIADLWTIMETQDFSRYSSWLDEWTGMDQDFCFDVNFLALDERRIIAMESSSPVVKELERRGIEVIMIPWRHRYFIKNGIHCCTLETKRKGTAEQYL